MSEAPESAASPTSAQHPAIPSRRPARAAEVSPTASAAASAAAAASGPGMPSIPSRRPRPKTSDSSGSEVSTSSVPIQTAAEQITSSIPTQSVVSETDETEVSPYSGTAASVPVAIPPRPRRADSPSVNLQPARNSFERDQQLAEVEMDLSRTLAEKYKDEPASGGAAAAAATAGDVDESEASEEMIPEALTRSYSGEEHIARGQLEMHDEPPVDEIISSAELSGADASASDDSPRQDGPILAHPQPSIPRRPATQLPTSTTPKIPERTRSSGGEEPLIPDRPASRPLRRVPTKEEETAPVANEPSPAVIEQQVPKIPSRPTTPRVPGRPASRAQKETETGASEGPAAVEPAVPHRPAGRPSRGGVSASTTESAVAPAAEEEGEKESPVVESPVVEPAVPHRPAGRPSRGAANTTAEEVAVNVPTTEGDAEKEISAVESPVVEPAVPHRPAGRPSRGVVASTPAATQSSQKIAESVPTTEESAEQDTSAVVSSEETPAIASTETIKSAEVEEKVDVPPTPRLDRTESDVLAGLIDSYTSEDGDLETTKEGDEKEVVGLDAVAEEKEKVEAAVGAESAAAHEDKAKSVDPKDVVPPVEETRVPAAEEQASSPLPQPEAPKRPSIPARPGVPRRPPRPSTQRSGSGGSSSSSSAVPVKSPTEESAPAPQPKPKPAPPARPNKLSGIRAAFAKDLESRLGKNGPMPMMMPRPPGAPISSRSVGESEAAGATEERPEETKSKGKETKLEDARKSRARGPRGRKLPTPAVVLPSGWGFSSVVTVWEVGYTETPLAKEPEVEPEREPESAAVKLDESVSGSLSAVETSEEKPREETKDGGELSTAEGSAAPAAVVAEDALTTETAAAAAAVAEEGSGEVSAAAPAAEEKDVETTVVEEAVSKVTTSTFPDGDEEDDESHTFYDSAETTAGLAASISSEKPEEVVEEEKEEEEEESEEVKKHTETAEKRKEIEEAAGVETASLSES
ncbi:hypothetical protein BZA70DRAFT_292294 [Myxozyma melibiosi]|uniref:Altered inheritance of mitochondria protein 21 n=1 Tax=Myxozyma melibiosi TaxID=54550 RepID=A0ABR1EXU8_9ASCO